MTVSVSLRLRRLALLLTSGFRQVRRTGFDLLRQCIAVLLVYSTIAATMPVQASEISTLSSGTSASWSSWTDFRRSSVSKRAWDDGLEFLRQNTAQKALADLTRASTSPLQAGQQLVVAKNTFQPRLFPRSPQPAVGHGLPRLLATTGN